MMGEQLMVSGMLWTFHTMMGEQLMVSGMLWTFHTMMGEQRMVEWHVVDISYRDVLTANG